jgi:hypothetical protein
MGMPPQAAYEENIRLHAKLARLREALEKIATKNLLSEQCREIAWNALNGPQAPKSTSSSGTDRASA